MNKFKLFFLVAGLFIFTALMAQDKRPAPLNSTSPTEKIILVKFKPEAKPAQIQALQSELGLQPVKEIPAIGVRVYRVTSTKPVKNVIAHLGKQALVEYAEPNQNYRALAK